MASVITDAAAARRGLRLIARGTWLDGGAPVSADAEPLYLDAFDGIIEYEPGDLTITVGAAMSVAELDAATAQHGQWCPLAPWGGDDGSVGATIATATAGPLAHALGLPRDLVLGVECVDGTGKTLRPGGKVVKNVAGFDLVRLMTGSWGSLAAITRVSLRLRARPAVDETWLVVTDAAADLCQRLRRSVTPPIACEVVTRGTLGANSPDGLLVRLAGNAAYVAAARDAVHGAGDAQRADASAWTPVRTAARPQATRAMLDPAVRALNDGVKHAFDPSGILNPGIMG
ncbi:MAG: FAD-binding protein [Gemmatimonadetes bacterium]|nr:FAD-binding protein [Gemmatimonadota bacterium]